MNKIPLAGSGAAGYDLEEFTDPPEVQFCDRSCCCIETSVGNIAGGSNPVITMPDNGDDTSPEVLLTNANERLLRLARRLKRDFPTVGRWEQTEDVLQNALVRLYQSLKTVEIQSSLHFHRLAALQIRRELIDLCRHYQGQYGVAKNHATWIPGEQVFGTNAPEPNETTGSPDDLAEWAEFHRQVDLLPDEDREVFDLIWYAGMSQSDVAAALNTSLKTIQRRWRGARLKLSETLGGGPSH